MWWRFIPLKDRKKLVGGWGCGCEMNCFIFPGRGTARRDQMQTRIYVLSTVTVFQYVSSSLWKIKNKGKHALFQPHRKDRIFISESINSEIYRSEPSELADLLHYTYIGKHMQGRPLAPAVWILRWFKEKRGATGSYFSVPAEWNPHFSKPGKMEVRCRILQHIKGR